MAQKLLIIDDDERLNALLTDYLAKFGFEVQAVAQPQQGLEIIRTAPPDLVILDVMLPTMDGFDVLRTIRRESQIPVIMLTARGEVTDRIVGLEIGADDYIPKPFEPRELVARIQTVLRRKQDIPSVSPTLRFGNLTVDLNRKAAFVNEKNCELTTAEFELLALFIRQKGKVLNREQIMDAIRHEDWEAFDRSVDVLVSRLRQKLGDDPKNPRFIKTVWGSGYLFIGENA
jgi:two-component system phosphate regulon response regulator OmpR